MRMDAIQNDRSRSEISRRNKHIRGKVYESHSKILPKEREISQSNHKSRMDELVLSRHKSIRSKVSFSWWDLSKMCPSLLQRCHEVNAQAFHHKFWRFMRVFRRQKNVEVIKLVANCTPATKRTYRAALHYLSYAKKTFHLETINDQMETEKVLVCNNTQERNHQFASAKKAEKLRDIFNSISELSSVRIPSAVHFRLSNLTQLKIEYSERIDLNTFTEIKCLRSLKIVFKNITSFLHFLNQKAASPWDVSNLNELWISTMFHGWNEPDRMGWDWNWEEILNGIHHQNSETKKNNCKIHFRKKLSMDILTNKELCAKEVASLQRLIQNRTSENGVSVKFSKSQNFRGEFTFKYENGRASLEFLEFLASNTTALAEQLFGCDPSIRELELIEDKDMRGFTDAFSKCVDAKFSKLHTLTLTIVKTWLDEFPISLDKIRHLPSLKMLRLGVVPHWLQGPDMIEKIPIMEEVIRTLQDIKTLESVYIRFKGSYELDDIPRLLQALFNLDNFQQFEFEFLVKELTNEEHAEKLVADLITSSAFKLSYLSARDMKAHLECKDLKEPTTLFGEIKQSRREHIVLYTYYLRMIIVPRTHN